MKKKAKKITLICLILVAAAVIAAVAGYNIYRRPATFRHLDDKSLDAQQVNDRKNAILEKADKKILVAYFSYSGTTKGAATALSEKTGADLFEIVPKNEYSNVYTQSNREIRRGEKPELAQTISNIEDYDIVFVGYPVWWHATPAPVNSFLESYDLTDKLIIPFCTSGESDIAETMPTFLDSCDGLAVYGEKRISSTGEIDGWLDELGLTIDTTETGSTQEEENSQTEAVTDEDATEPEITDAATEEVSASDTEIPDADGKTLIAYFSWSTSGNTEKMATYIKEQTGGDILKLEPATPYPTDYSETGDVAKVERDENARPEIANLPDSISEYDTILVGYPIWWHTAPMIIGTFLENYDLTGVDIYPFAQSASMDTEQFANSMDFVRENASGANVHDGLFTEPDDTAGISDYLTTNKLVK